MKKILFSASTDMLSDYDVNLINSHCETRCIINFVDLESLEGRDNYVVWVVHPCPSFIISEKVLDFLPNIKTIVTPTTGTTHIDILGLQKVGINVIGLKGSKVVDHIKASSEFTFIHVLNVLRNFSKSIDHVKNGKWREGDSDLRGHEICESTVGIVGLGRIGGNVARWLTCMGAKVFYHDPYVNSDDFKRYDNIIDLASAVDVLVIAVHLSQETKGMIDMKVLKNMRCNSWLVNTSRGEVIVEEDLINALNNHIIAGASIDVITGENEIGFVESNKLISLAKNISNLIITPHVAGLTFESEAKAQIFAFREAMNCI
jgi:D-3-phosphoglycerate dehydrogenase